MLQSVKGEHDEEEIEALDKEIAKLQSQVNEAQYGPKENETGKKGEQKEIERIEKESIPQLESLLGELQNQLAEKKQQPFYIQNESTAQFQTKKQRLFNQEYFQKDLGKNV